MKYVNGGETETENTCQRQCLNLSIHSPPLGIVPLPFVIWLTQYPSLHCPSNAHNSRNVAVDRRRHWKQDEGEKANRNRQRNGKTFNVNVLSTNVKWPVVVVLVLLHVFVLAKNKTQKRRDEGRTHEAKIHLKLIRFNAPLDSKGKQLFSCSAVQLVNCSLGQLGNWPWLSRLSSNKIND